MWRSWTPGAARAVAVVLLAVLAVVVWWWWQGRPRAIDMVDTVTPADVSQPSVPQSDVVSAIPGGAGAEVSTDTEMVTVHIIGRVRRPGIVRIPAGSRVADAIDAAGGLRDPRAAVSVNLARIVSDGEQIDVRRNASVGGGPQASSDVGHGGVVNLNQASPATLETLPGIGPVLAARIVAWRDANGPFPSVEVLGEVSGIGPALMSRLAGLVTV
jgi:competence protein ComEA